MYEFDCAACAGPLTLLGFLGSLAWTRCRYCGLEQSPCDRDTFNALEEAA
jgi:hypothetical protein